MLKMGDNWHLVVAWKEQPKKKERKKRKQLLRTTFTNMAKNNKDN